MKKSTENGLGVTLIPVNRIKFPVGLADHRTIRRKDPISFAVNLPKRDCPAFMQSPVDDTYNKCTVCVIAASRFEAESGVRAPMLRASAFCPPTGGHTINNQPIKNMLHWTLVFLVVAVIAAILGYGGIAGTATGIAKILFIIFLVLWLASFLLRSL